MQRRAYSGGIVYRSGGGTVACGGGGTKKQSKRLTKVLDQDAGATFGGSVVCSVVCGGEKFLDAAKVVFAYGLDRDVMLGGFAVG